MEVIKPEIAEKIHQLEEKFRNSGQDLGSYLDGLLYDKYLTYWDYVHLDTLLSLQTPRTHFPDEEVFITYHQITELYFKLILHEQKQIEEAPELPVAFFVEKLNRIIRYFRILTSSFDVMIRGMDREEFQKFRMALLPASGFQSAQFRMIEMFSTPLKNLLHPSERQESSEDLALEEIYEKIYWKRGATTIETGEKTLTLKQFEKKYTARFLRLAHRLQGRTIYERYQSLSEADKNNKNLREALRTLDVAVNVNYLLVHIGAAQRYLVMKNKSLCATGGTNWEEFLPPSFQKIIFFPDLWSVAEKANWGKQWVEETYNIKSEYN